MNPLSDTSDTPAGVPGSTPVFFGWWRSSGEVQTHTEGKRSFVIGNQTLSSVCRSCDVAFRLSEKTRLQINTGAGESLFLLLSRHHHHHHSTLVFFYQYSKMSRFINPELFKAACDWDASSRLRWSTCDCGRSHPECTAISSIRVWKMAVIAYAKLSRPVGECLNFCLFIFCGGVASTISAHKMALTMLCLHKLTRPASVASDTTGSCNQITIFIISSQLSVGLKDLLF